jgi:small-conductance mechanosensitive channel
MKLMGVLDVHQMALIGLLIAVLVAFIFLSRRMGRRAKAEGNQFLRLLISHLSGPAELLLIMALIYIGLDSLPDAWAKLSWVRKPMALVTVFAVAWMAIRGMRFLATLLLRSRDMDNRENVNVRMIHTQVRLIQRIASSLIVMVALAAGLMVFDQIRTLGISLLASAGFAGIVLGLAAQKTLGNFFTGMQIALTQPIRLDDVVVVEDQWGWIDEINLTYVVIRKWDLSMLILPISYFVEKPFQTWTRRTSDMLGTISLFVDYTMPIEPLREELKRILDATNLWDKKTSSVQIVNTTSEAMEVRVLISAAHSSALWDLRCLIREKLIEFIQKNYPQHLPRIRAELRDRTA